MWYASTEREAERLRLFLGILLREQECEGLLPRLLLQMGEQTRELERLRSSLM